MRVPLEGDTRAVNAAAATGSRVTPLRVRSINTVPAAGSASVCRQHACPCTGVTTSTGGSRGRSPAVPSWRPGHVRRSAHDPVLALREEAARIDRSPLAGEFELCGTTTIALAWTEAMVRSMALVTLLASSARAKWAFRLAWESSGIPLRPG